MAFSLVKQNEAAIETGAEQKETNILNPNGLIRHTHPSEQDSRLEVYICDEAGKVMPPTAEIDR
jgi:hypothetical protein